MHGISGRSGQQLFPAKNPGRERTEDFYRSPYSAETPDELKNLRIEMSYGVSDLSPEDAILQMMMGNPAEEHNLLTIDFVPECRKAYDMKLISDGEDGWQLVPIEQE